MSPQGVALTILVATLACVALATVLCVLWDAVRDARGWR